jgi:hypothetical protein
MNYYSGSSKIQKVLIPQAARGGNLSENKARFRTSRNDRLVRPSTIAGLIISTFFHPGPATGLRIIPIRPISTSTMSPAFRKTGGCRVKPTPAGVPVEMISPGSRVISELRKAIVFETGKIMSLVFPCWRVAPFTLVAIGKDCGSGI